MIARPLDGTAAIVLAAGVGSRLRPHTDDRPKCLVTLGTETILGRAVRLLAAAGATRLIVSTGYRAEAVHAALADAPLPVSYVDNPDYAQTQNVVSLARAMGALAPGEGMVKLDGDVIFTADVLARLGGAADAFDARVLVEPASPGLGAEEMKVEMVDGRIRRFGKQLDPRRCYGESIGIERFEPGAAAALAAALAQAIAARRTEIYYEEVYSELVDAVTFRPVAVAAPDWCEIDDARDLARARGRFAPG